MIHEFDTETYIGCECEQCTRLRAEDELKKEYKPLDDMLTKMMEEGTIPYSVLDLTQYEYLVTLMAVTAFERVLDLMKKAARGKSNEEVNVDKLIKAAHSVRVKMGRKL